MDKMFRCLHQEKKIETKNYRLVLTEEPLIKSPSRLIALVNFESDGMFTFSFLLLLKQRNDDRASTFVVIGIRVVQVQEKLRIHRKGS